MDCVSKPYCPVRWIIGYCASLSLWQYYCNFGTTEMTALYTAGRQTYVRYYIITAADEVAAVDTTYDDEATGARRSCWIARQTNRQTDGRKRGSIWQSDVNKTTGTTDGPARRWEGRKKAENSVLCSRAGGNNEQTSDGGVRLSKQNRPGGRANAN